MFCSNKMSKSIIRPSFILFFGVVILALCGTSMRVSGSPLPQDDKDISKNIHESFDQATNHAKDFFERAKNTFSGKADANNPGLKTWEIIAIVAGAILLFMFGFCCIGFCLCECVKELVCCICCCSGCRD